MGKRGTKDIYLRVDPEFHEQLTIFLLQLSAAKSRKVSIQEFCFEAIKEKMEKTKKEHGIA